MARREGGVNIRELQRLGAAIRLRQIITEWSALLRAFPDLVFFSQLPPAPPETHASRRRKMRALRAKILYLESELALMTRNTARKRRLAALLAVARAKERWYSRHTVRERYDDGPR